MHDWAFALGPGGLDAMDRAGAIAAAVSGAGVLMVLAAVAGCLATPILQARGLLGGPPAAIVPE